MSSPPSLPSATFKIGNSVSGVSSCGDPFGGVVYAVDDTLGLAVLRAPGDIQNSHHVQIINCDANTKTDVKVLNSVSPPPNSRGEEEGRAALPVIDKGRQERRFETAVKAAQFVADNIGENVTEEAQEIFDALARTLPCRWKNQEIIVLDEISIPPPYTTPAGGDELFRERIKNVLVHERRRLGMS
mmetsp:Transcript_5327/g.18145  ORF Transcript_5327/g.18145 Transcript_5327/m.18145 type:complete len:186 (+) Transcript_5327:61-618(+)